MIRTILSIAGKPGLYRLVNQGRNMLIVESLATGKRTPAYARDKVMSLGDIAMYTTEEDIPLAELREYFGTILTNFDRERVHDSDIRKLFQWYNTLLAAGITEFKAPEAEESAEEDKAE